MAKSYSKSECEKISDEELVLLAKKGNAKASNYLINKYYPYVISKSRTYFLIGGDKEDIIQEGLIGLYRAIKDYNPNKNTSFSTFANLCITRQIITAIKTATRGKHGPLNSYISFNKIINNEDKEVSLLETFINNDFENPETVFLEIEMINEINDKIKKTLSEFEKNVLELYREGFSYEEIAKKLKKDEKSIDNAIQRIRRKLSSELL